MASIERRESVRRDAAGKQRRTVRFTVRYWDGSGRQRRESFARMLDAERRKLEVETALADGTWNDPRRGEIRLNDWAAAWLPTRHDLRATTQARLETTMKRQVLPAFGDTPLVKISNAAVRRWVAGLIDQGYSAATVRKAVFALRQCLDAAVEDRRLTVNPAAKVPLPVERAKTPRFLSQREVERLASVMPEQYRALVLVGVYAGLRWGEAVGLTRSHIDVTRSGSSLSTLRSRCTGRFVWGRSPRRGARSARCLWPARSCGASRSTWTGSSTRTSTPWCSPQRTGDRSTGAPSGTTSGVRR